MDMLPPQAPPAQVAHANQPAITAIERMSGIQGWLAAQREALPGAMRKLDGRTVMLAELDAFWDAAIQDVPGEAPVPRRQAFAARLAEAVREDALLRGNDGTLSGSAVAMVRSLVRNTAGALPGHLHAHELLMGAVPYAGALVLRDDREPGTVLLFTTTSGCKAFGSLHLLLRDVEWQMRAQLATRSELPGMGAEDVDEAIGKHFLSTREVHGQIFDTLARRVVARLRERVTDAWELADTEAELYDRLQDALDLHALLDVHAIVRHRDLDLAAKVEAERLARLPADVSAEWLQAAKAYRELWLEASDDPLAAPSLALFANEELAAALEEKGMDEAPSDIRVRLTRRVPDRPIASLISGFPHEDMSLLELAYRNVAASRTDALEVIHPDGTPRNDISADTLAAIVRGLDLPNRYSDHIDTHFGHTAEGRERRARTLALHRAALRFEAAEARAADSDADAGKVTFRHPASHRWLKAVLDHPETATARRARVDGQEISVRQFTYKGAPLTEVFAISMKDGEASPRILLYTPGAPDGLTFREFEDRAELQRRFFLDRRFESYLLDRLPVEFGEVGPKGDRRFRIVRLNADRPVSWVLGTDDCEGCTLPGDRFIPAEVPASFFGLAYDQAIDLARHNARQLARSTPATEWQTVSDAFHWAAIPALIVKELVMGAVESVPRTAQASWRFYDKVKGGENTEAFLAFVEGYTSALNVLPLYTHVPGLAGAAVRASAGSRVLTGSRRSVPPPDTLFEKGFIARDLTVPARKPASAVFFMGDEQVILQHGKLYRVRYDANMRTWRLNRRGAGDSNFTGPAIVHRADGLWHHHRVGALGGGNLPGRQARPTAPQPPPDLFADDALLNPDVAALTPYQRNVLVDRLRHRLTNDAYDRTLRLMLGRQTQEARLSAIQRWAWCEALSAGRGSPTVRPLQALPLIPGRQYPVSSNFGVLAPEAWPDHAYAYFAEPVSPPASGATGIALQGIRVSRYQNQDMMGLPVTTLPPTTPLPELPAGIEAWFPRPPATPGGTLGSATGGWVRIDLSQLRPGPGIMRWRPTDAPDHVALAEPFQLHWVTDHGYVLRGGTRQTPHGPPRVLFNRGELEFGPAR
jgi:hypothetical protein